MAWTATMVSKTRDSQNRIAVTVDITNGTITERSTWTTDTAPAVAYWVERQIKAKIAQLEALDTWAASLPAPGAAVDLNVNTNPTAAETAAATWQNEYRTLKQMNQALADGLIASNNPQRTAQITKVRDAFVYPDYLPYLRA